MSSRSTTTNNNYGKGLSVRLFDLWGLISEVCGVKEECLGVLCMCGDFRVGKERGFKVEEPW